MISDEDDSLTQEVDNDEEIDDRKHALMLDAVSSLDGKKDKKLSQRTVLTTQISEFNFSASGGKVKLHELLGSLKQTTSHGTLKKHLQSVQKGNQTVSVPLPKHEKQKIERGVAYEKTKEDLSRWSSVVTKNRNSEQIVYPLNQPDLRVHTTDQFVKRFQVRTPLEMEVAKLLHGNDNVLTSDAVLTPAEEKALKAMSLEEAKERRAELQRHRALLSYKEAKAKRQKKIKSKKFHKILKKEKLKEEKKALEELQKTDPEAYNEKIMSVDRQRMQERMSLKHRGGSKFARKQMIYAKYDEKARQGVQDMLHKSRELTQKTVVESDSENESNHGGDETILEGGLSSTLLTEKNPWMTVPKTPQSSGYHRLQAVVNPEAVANQALESEQENVLQCVTQDVVPTAAPGVEEDLSNSVADNNLIEEIFANKKLKKQIQSKSKKSDQKIKTKSKVKSTKSNNNMSKKSERTEKFKSECVLKEEEKTKSVEEEEGVSFINISSKRRKTMEDIEGEWSDEEEMNDGLRAHRTVDLKSEKFQGPVTEIQVDPEKLFTVESSLSQTRVADMISDEETDMQELQKMTIAQAFADDDVIEEFRQEKDEVVEKGKPKDIDLTLPGWGEWAGTGVKPSKRKSKKLIIKAAPAKPRKDRMLGNVIISEKKDEAIKKYQVSVLPHPYSTVEQFQQSIRAPIGNYWNSETAFKKLIEPKIVTQMGSVIEPIDRSVLLQHEERLQKRKADMDLPEGSIELKKKKFDKKNKAGLKNEMMRKNSSKPVGKKKKSSFNRTKKLKKDGKKKVNLLKTKNKNHNNRKVVKT